MSEQLPQSLRGPIRRGLTLSRAPNRSADAPGDERYRAPALDKGLDILELLAGQAQGLTRAEIVKAMGRSPSEIYRMLERLVARQYVARSAEGDRYTLSLKLFVLAQRHPPQARLVSQAVPVMDAFTKAAEQSCHLGVYDRGNVTIVAQVASPAYWGLSIRAGARVSLLDSGSGLTLLAFQTPEGRAGMLAEHEPLEGETRRPAARALEATLAQLRAQGHWQSDSRQTFGVTDISLPVLGPDGAALAALTCPYVRRIDRHPAPDLDATRALLARAAQALSLR